jgi:hypothetical protein
MSVEVPKAFASLGYSGLFHTTATFPDQTTRDTVRAKPPYLVGNTGWMVLAVNDDGDAVMVRRDSAAIVDMCTIRPPQDH